MLHEPGLLLTGTFFHKYKTGKGFQHLQSTGLLKKTNAVTFRKTFQLLHSSEAGGFEQHQEGNHGRVASLGWFSSAVLPEMEGDTRPFHA